MNCARGSDTLVKDSRPYDNRTSIWRKRQCKSCGTIFTTVEQVCETLPCKKGKPFGAPSAIAKPEKHKVKPPEVTPTLRPKRARPKKTKDLVLEKPALVDAVTPKPRNRIEDLKEQRELQKLDEWL